MHLVYENTKEEIIAIKKTPVHRPPHLHNALEIVYVTEGCVELGVGEELFHMDQGDIGFIFPNIIHHYQVFSCQRLENTNDTITELCLDSGFKSLRTFNRAFKEKFKTSPSEYRKTFVRNWNMM